MGGKETGEVGENGILGKKKGIKVIEMKEEFVLQTGGEERFSFERRPWLKCPCRQDG